MTIDTAGPNPMKASTGLPALDLTFQELRPGDNVVWRVDSIDDYIPFAEAVVRYARSQNLPITYFRFANHRLIATDQPGVRTCLLNPEEGFETFITSIHRIIRNHGRGGYYLFDSLSDLSNNCYSDRMIGNFFKLTCPYLFQLDTIAYFAMYRHYHSYHAASPIAETTQLLVDVYRYEGQLYVQPAHVQDRHTPSIFMLHAWEKDDRFTVVKESHLIAKILSSSPWTGLPSASYRMAGVWDKVFMHAEEILEARKRGEYPKETEDQVFHQLSRLILTRDEPMLKLCERYMTLADVLHIWKRMIGTGLIGGKSIGMLLARAILCRHHPSWRTRLEEHDSFFIGSDVFYTFLVENRCWWDRQKQKDPATFLQGAQAIRDRMLSGDFPSYIVTRFADMLDYFGQSPIIVRSSSLLEDNFGNAFAGKYESVFCANQGTREERLRNFLSAVRFVYASTVSVEALNYRKKRGVLDDDEQMALLVQRVSGAPYGAHFFPHLAGVAFSFNPYAWSKQIDPEAGMLRLVFGLGTRAVDRSDDDYTRLVALNAPDKRPESNFDEVKRYAQRRVDVLDLASNAFANIHFLDLLNHCPGVPARLFASRDRTSEFGAAPSNSSWILTFENVFKKTGFIQDMRDMLAIVKEAYHSHVDIEFTTNFLTPDDYRIHLLQCRPMQLRPLPASDAPLPAVAPENIVLEAHGAVIGQTRALFVNRLIYVVPSAYSRLNEQDRYAVARLIGQLTHVDESPGRTTVLMGPGRWGTSTPSLGIPVSFSEIHMASVLCEVDAMHEGLIPDLSLGTHFLNEMVEMNMLYMAYFGERKGNRFDEALLMDAPNRLVEILPDALRWSEVVRVMDGVGPDNRWPLYLTANALEQVALIYCDRKPPEKRSPGASSESSPYTIP